MIYRLEISESDTWDMYEVDELLKDYEVLRENIISITHENGMVYLYYFIKGEKQ